LVRADDILVQWVVVGDAFNGMPNHRAPSAAYLARLPRIIFCTSEG
jgi:hypothetical protein